MKKLKLNSIVSLKDKFRYIKENHRKNILKRVAKVCVGSSTVRVFKHSHQIRGKLQDIDVEKLLDIQNEDNFREWFENKLDEVTKVIPKTTSRSKKITDGARKWGYGAKILNLFLRDIVFQHRYFAEKDADRIQSFLYVPLDSIVLGQLHELGKQRPKKIKNIDSSEKFYKIQEKLGDEAKKAKVPRIWFDDMWVDQQ